MKTETFCIDPATPRPRGKLRIGRITKALKAKLPKIEPGLGTGSYKLRLNGTFSCCTVGKLSESFGDPGKYLEPAGKDFFGVHRIVNDIIGENDSFKGTPEERLDHMIAWFKAVREAQREREWDAALS